MATLCSYDYIAHWKKKENNFYLAISFSENGELCPLIFRTPTPVTIPAKIDFSCKVSDSRYLLDEIEFDFSFDSDFGVINHSSLIPTDFMDVLFACLLPPPLILDFQQPVSLRLARDIVCHPVLQCGATVCHPGFWIVNTCFYRSELSISFTKYVENGESSW